VTEFQLDDLKFHETILHFVYEPEIDLILTSISSQNCVYHISSAALPLADGIGSEMHAGWKK